jgi:hypothetical protein
MRAVDPKMARSLRELRREAETRLGDGGAAENWVCTPHPDLPGITPAEAVQYEGLATGVLDLLPGEARTATATGRGLPIIVDQIKADKDRNRSIPELVDGDEIPTSPQPDPSRSDQENLQSRET